MSRLIRLLNFGLPFLLASACIAVPSPALAQTGSIDFTATQQHVEGFGFSEAFGEAASLNTLAAAKRGTLLDLIYSPTIGAGFSIYRIGINTDSLIEPNSPGSPGATPTYVFDGSDRSQVWMAQEGQKYGLNDFYADAWSAPGFMKTNNSIDNGGNLCGSPGATACATGDWRQAYANFLIEFVNLYGGVGVPIHNLGFTNEPDENVTYASMLFTPAQAVDFIKVLGPTIQSSGLPLRMLCCDSSKWTLTPPFVTAITADPVASPYVYAISSHEYGGHATSPLATTKPVWMTEWSSSNSTFNALWDCGGCSGGPDGMYLANDVIQAFNAGNVNAYLYWWGTSTGAAALILESSSGAGSYTVAGRYYAIAAISRLVRPDAYRVSSTNTNANLNVVAFRNTNGGKVIAVINTASTAIPSSFTVDAGTANSTVKTYLTDTSHNIVETDTAVVIGQTLSDTFPQRSLTTIVLPPTTIAGSVDLATTTTLEKLGDGSFEAAVKIANNGTGTVQNVQLTSALLGSAAGAPAPGVALPQTIGSIAPGGYQIVPLNFPSSAGSSGSATTEHFAGTYIGGTFGGSMRAVLP